MSETQVRGVNNPKTANPNGLERIRVGVLGFGGLGQAATRVLAPKGEMLWVAAADRKGYVYDAAGLNPERCIQTYQSQGSLGYVEPGGTLSSKSIEELIQNATVDGYFLALPNLPNTFMASVVKQFIQSGWQGVLVDALKRTSAVEQLLLAIHLAVATVV
ncbi:MAG: saccharopine dehydrogenase-like oxidoreductase, partial [Moorea sp. SIO3E2]|nr:saccharopine dehydrogenase-like oxidoreductase [Moorena sp. SIO3E2]